MKIRMELPENKGYDIIVERNCLKKVGEHFSLDRKVLIVTDTGVPETYSKTVAEACKTPVIAVIPMGEESKSMDMYTFLLRKMLENGFTRKDCVVAVGGGVVGDLAGFVAASYMRGVDFYNVPTTLLSQIDSSIGGKVAIDLDGIKNIVGAFYQPQKVLIDPNVLVTLEKRQFSAGLAEAVKMALTFDSDLFELIEKSDIEENIDRIIIGSLNIKKNVVEQDEKECGLRRVLNFGHTVGHGIESSSEFHGLYHGECVAIGMLPMCSPKVRERLLPVLEKAGLPTTVKCDVESVCTAMIHDKKAESDFINVIYVNEIGSFEIVKESKEVLIDNVKKFF